MNPKSWMWNLDGSLKLSDICMPGSHDAGMYKLTLADYLARTQNLNISEQLNHGVRFFDLRPGLKENGNFITYHGDDLIALGGELIEILDHVESFLEKDSSSKEVVLLQFSHYKNLTSKPVKSDHFQDKLKQCIQKHLSSSHRIFYTDLNKNLYNTTLNEVKGKAIVIFGDKNGIYDNYANEDDFEKMQRDQRNKFENFKEEKLFMLNWTLTPQSIVSKSIKLLSNEPNSKMNADRKWLIYKNTHGKMVNIINVDYYSHDKYPYILETCQTIINNADVNPKLLEFDHFDIYPLNATCYNSSNEKYYFFRGKYFWTKKYGNHPIQGPYPIQDDSQWAYSHLTDSDDFHSFDAVCFKRTWNTKRYYFFKGSKYWAKDDGEKVEKSKSISTGWENLSSYIKAGCFNKTDSVYYFFKGNYYQKFPKGGSASNSKKVTNWPKNSTDYDLKNIDAVCYNSDSEEYYFFRGEYYYYCDNSDEKIKYAGHIKNF